MKRGHLFQKGHTINKGRAVGRPPDVILNLSEQDIIDLGEKGFNSKEDDILRGLGVPEKSLANVKGGLRWRRNFDRGRALGRNKYNEVLVNSKDATIQKVVASHSLPPLEIIQEGYEFVIDAPEWFKKGVGNKKTKAKN